MVMLRVAGLLAKDLSGMAVAMHICGAVCVALSAISIIIQELLRGRAYDAK